MNTDVIINSLTKCRVATGPDFGCISYANIFAAIVGALFLTAGIYMIIKRYDHGAP